MRIEVLLLLLLILTMPILYGLSNTLDPGPELQRDDEDQYEILIEVSQWEYKVFDLVEMNIGIQDIDTLTDEFKLNYEMKYEIQVRPSLPITIHIRSRDVDHAIRFDEVDFTLSAMRPETGEEFGAIQTGSFILPNEDEKLNGYSPIPVGLRTDDMSLNINVGNPDLGINIGLISALIVLLSSFIYFVYRTHNNPTK